ncbi:MAG: hypothetical protein KAZ14_00585 [Nitrosomonas sp.]|nr:hypothetical protein [Nitrosomonas sp.]
MRFNRPHGDDYLPGDTSLNQIDSASHAAQTQVFSPQANSNGATPSFVEDNFLKFISISGILILLVFIAGYIFFKNSSPEPPPNTPSIPAKVTLYPTTNVHMRTSPCVRQDNYQLYQDKTRVVVKVDDATQRIETNGQAHYCTESDTKEQTPWVLVTVENQTIKGSATAWVNACKFKADKAYFPCISVMEIVPPVAVVPPPPPVEVEVKPTATPEQLAKLEQEAQVFDCGSWSSFVMKKDYRYKTIEIMKGDHLYFIRAQKDVNTVAIITKGKEIGATFSIRCKELYDLYK